MGLNTFSTNHHTDEGGSASFSDYRPTWLHKQVHAEDFNMHVSYSQYYGKIKPRPMSKFAAEIRPMSYPKLAET